ncbi:hypothetical protein [Brachybacterium sp. YJGR34]|uniref:hypothetical protein n=1 Tax=Brachybacterium sp. YJGR34 TaxID=2059911 RepID=UPI0013006837|nr:hypothetical protein [Brachybacterium sp. YJGR34]
MMIRPDEQSPTIARGTAEEVATFLDDLAAGGDADGLHAMPAALVASVGEILAGASGRAEVTLSDPQGYSTHAITLSRAGVLRRSRGLTGPEELAVHSTGTVPGLLLRLAALSPTEPLPATVRLAAPAAETDALFSAMEAERRAAWEALSGAAAALPPAARPATDQAAPRAAQLLRHRPSGAHGAVVVMLRGRYLVPDAESSTLHGVSPTGASRALMSALLAP